MSHTRVKGSYSVEIGWGNTESKTVYCHHNHTCDCVTFYDEEGNIMNMSFCETGQRDLWDLILDLMSPFKDQWGGELKEGIEFYKEIGD